MNFHPQAETKPITLGEAGVVKSIGVKQEVLHQNHYHDGRKRRFGADDVCASITNQGGFGVRRSQCDEMTLFDLKRIASYPDAYKFGGSLNTQWERIGNSVPPLFMRAIASRVRDLIGKGPAIRTSSLPGNYLASLEAAWQDHLKPREPDAPTVISTFAGGGGSSLGYSMAGYHELLAVEWDKNAIETFHLNFPKVPFYHGDIAKLTVAACLKMAQIEPGQLDVLDGSPPCQGFSTAGKRNLDDPRNSLFKEYVRLLRGLKPKAFVMENVSGMVKGKMKLVFAEILRELKASGYTVKARLLNAMYFGVPQSRQRMIFVGIREDLGIEPSHPKGQTRPLAFGDAMIMGISGQLSADDLERWRRIPMGGNFNDLPLRLRTSARFSDAFRKLHVDRPAYTLPKTDGNLTTGAFFHPTEPRRICRKEKSRIGSYPDSFIWAGNEQDVAARIGNSVPPLFMKSIALHVRGLLNPSTLSGVASA